MAQISRCYSLLFIVPIGHDPSSNSDPSAYNPYNESLTADLYPTCVQDFTLMRQLGINAIRLYSATQYHNATPCLDAAWNEGDQPIYVVMCFWIDYKNWDVTVETTFAGSERTLRSSSTLIMEFAAVIK